MPMNMQDYFSQIRSDIAEEKFGHLGDYPVTKPESFNWVADIFEPLNVDCFGDHKALIWKSENREEQFTYRQMNNKANQLLNFLRKNGVDKGDRFYTQLPLVPANWVSYLAAIKGGLILIPAATTLAVRDIAYRFENLFPQVVIADEENAAKIDEAAEQFKQSVKVRIITDGEREGWYPLSVIDEEPGQAAAAATLSDDPLFYFFTSGTTDLPKVVVHTQFTYPFGHLSTAAWVGLRQGDVHYNISAPGWAKFAWSSFFAPWNVGATIFANQVSTFNAREQLQTMEQYGITTFCAPPTVLRMLIQQDLSAYNLQFRQCVAAGEPLNPDVIEKWKSGTGTLIRDGYGQTETTCLAANMPYAPVKYGSMGKPTFLYDLVIADDDGKEQPPLEEGHICVKQESGKPGGVFLDYLGDTERRARAFKHGLYYTGDKAYRDEEGYIWFVGRNDDVIKASDYRVGPFEVESVMVEHEAVVEAAVVGSPHELRGHAIKAFLVLKNGYEPGSELAGNLFEFAESNLAKYKIPRIIEFVTYLPKTISGKIRRVELRGKEAEEKMQQVEKASEFFHEKY